MASKIPYILSTGLVPKVLEKIQQARRPERFTQDFLRTKLGFTSGSAMPFIPLLKRMGFLGSDGSPTSLYNQFRNDETQGGAVAEGLRNAFGELFDRNEYVYELTRDQLTSLVVEVTGGTKEDRTTKSIVGTFWALKELADFEGDSAATNDNSEEQSGEQSRPIQIAIDEGQVPPAGTSENVELKVSYTINLNLPETDDPKVFNAIFRALKENMLKN